MLFVKILLPCNVGEHIFALQLNDYPTQYATTGEG